MSKKLRLYDEMCPRCGNDQVSAMVDDRIPEDHAADGDIVTCADCGLQGLFDIDDQAECANVIWIWDEYAIEDYP